jgi:hypothetical protein
VSVAILAGPDSADAFSSGKDGSRQVTMQVDAAGTGAKFVAGKVTTNGELAPTSKATEKITASLPAGTTCTGGASGDLCLASFTTAGGFGNCVVVQQGAGGGAAAGGAATGGANAGNTATGKNAQTMSFMQPTDRYDRQHWRGYRQWKRQSQWREEQRTKRGYR